MSAKKLFNAFKIFILISILAFSSKTFAQIDLQCEPVPDCVTLGYQQEVECPNGAYVNCPFDASYKKCVNQNCVDLGFSATDKTRWCKKIVPCPTDLAYTLCDELDPCASYNLTLDQSLTYDAHCYNCTVCNSGSGNRYKCTEQLQAGYYVIDGQCTYNPCDGYDIDSTTYLTRYASEPEVHCQTCESCVTPEGPTVYKCNNSTPEDGYFVATNGVCSKDACYDYRLPESLAVGDAENCYDCTQCPVTGPDAPLFGGYWKCLVHEKNDYHLVGTECVQDPCPGYTVTQAEYESKYGSEDGQHCYDCQKCNNEDSTYNGNWKCTAKQNIESPYSLNGNGECVSDPCAGYDMTQAQKNSFLAQGDNSHCYSCRRCTITSSEFYNKWNCSPKDPIDEHYRLIGEVCEPDPCIDYTITPEQYTSTYSQGDYSKCFKYTQCQDSSSDFYGYYKQELKSSSQIAWGYYVQGDQCLKDPCYDDYDISSSQLQNYDDHCYDCNPCPYSPSGNLSNYYTCTANPDFGYELVNGRCAKQPCADYTISDINSYTQNMGPYWHQCVEFEQCNDPNAPDEFKNNYKIIDITSSTGWKINNEGECVLCENGHLCRDKTPGDVACSDENLPATFYDACYTTETCFNNEDITADCGSLGTGKCTAPKNKPTYSYTYVKTHYSCQTIDLVTVNFYQPLTEDYCKPDCECNCNPIYHMQRCKAVNYEASYCYGTTSDGLPCNAVSDAGCSPYRKNSIYWCSSCNDTYQCELMNNTYYDENGSVVPSRYGCSIHRLSQNHCSSSSPSPAGCNWYEIGSSTFSLKGFYFVDEVCANSNDNTKIVYTTSCTQNGNDCEGGTPPAYNRKTNRPMKTCISSETPYTYAYDSNGELLYDDDNNLVKLYGSDASPVYCGGYAYYDGCEGSGSSCTETCSRYPEEAAYSGYNKCELIYTKGTTKTGYTYHHTKCDQVCSNYSYAYFSSCTGEQTDKDCTGNPPVAAGMRICPSDYELVGRTVQCGGNTYAEACRQKCNYDETEASCLAQGLCFIERCRNEANQVFGECTNC